LRKISLGCGKKRLLDRHAPGKIFPGVSKIAITGTKAESGAGCSGFDGEL